MGFRSFALTAHLSGTAMYQVLVHALGLHLGNTWSLPLGKASCLEGEMGVKKIHMMTIMQRKKERMEKVNFQDEGTGKKEDKQAPQPSYMILQVTLQVTLEP